MRQHFTAFLQNANAELSATLEKRRKERLQASINPTPEKENSIFHQENRIRLSKIQLEQIQSAMPQLGSAQESLVYALAALEGFEGITKRELLLAASFTHGYIYMLNEFMRQTQGDGGLVCNFKHNA